MAAANHAVKHFGLHRFENVELRVVADAEDGILRVEQAALDVLAKLATDARWQHETVTLFVLNDLQPLVRQLDTTGRRPADARLQRREDLLSRPLVNVYDLASPTACNVFMNRQAMMAAGYWEDAESIRALLAHEHAHPLAENQLIATLRTLSIDSRLTLQGDWAADPARARGWAERAHQQVAALISQLFLIGPREVFTNQIAIEAGFDHALYHLNRRNVHNLVAGMAFRPLLAQQLEAVVAAGQLTKAGAALLQFIGDLQAYLPLTMEVAPFRRANAKAKARELMKPLYHDVFSGLEPEVKPLFEELIGQYRLMDPNAGVEAARALALYGLARAGEALADYDAELSYSVEAGTQA
ncbi:MAG: hypothetical protein IPK16_03110 [Anaerolineales bacterium]|nr:hypothetical protein [Anaerolineales bacterium]